MPGWQRAPELDIYKKAGTDTKGQFKSLYIDNAESVGNRKIG